MSIDISVKMAKNLLKRKIIMHQTKGMKGENQYGDAESDKGICGTNMKRKFEKLADQLRMSALPQPTEELFSEFETNGNRIRYEAVYFGRRSFYQYLVLQV